MYLEHKLSSSPVFSYNIDTKQRLKGEKVIRLVGGENYESKVRSLRVWVIIIRLNSGNVNISTPYHPGCPPGSNSYTNKIYNFPDLQFIKQP